MLEEDNSLPARQQSPHPVMFIMIYILRVMPLVICSIWLSDKWQANFVLCGLLTLCYEEQADGGLWGCIRPQSPRHGSPRGSRPPPLASLWAGCRCGSAETRRGRCWGEHLHNWEAGPHMSPVGRGWWRCKATWNMTLTTVLHSSDYLLWESVDMAGEGET